MDDINDETETHKYQPYDYFLKKKSKKLEKPSDVLQLRIAWGDLSDEKRLKFIKKAEKQYDLDHESIEITRENRFFKYLTPNEMKILMDSYNYPQKIPETIRDHFITKIREKDGLDFNAASHAYTALSAVEKEELFEELLNLKEMYYRNYAEFLDGLPPNRYLDYRSYAAISIKPTTTPKKRTPAAGAGSNESKTPTKTKIPDFMLPYEIYFEKNADKFKEETLFKSKLKARQAFKELDNEKKMKYVRKCADKFDEIVNNGVLISSVLNKNELQLLFESYGMPATVPKAFNSYYIKHHYNDEEFQDFPSHMRFKYISEKVKLMSATEKAKLLEKHQKAYEEYDHLLEAFEASLPKTRLTDYQIFSHKILKRVDENGTKNHFDLTASNTDHYTSEIEGNTTQDEAVNGVDDGDDEEYQPNKKKSKKRKQK